MENKRTLANDPQYFGTFIRFFNCKGITGPIAEKAIENFTKKRKIETNKKQRIHYFAIGHAFKQIDCKTIFDYVLDEKKQKEVPQKFLSLQTENFIDDEEIYKLLNSIRNINSHYVHDFNCLNLNNLSNQLKTFLKESFELAIIQIYLKEKKEIPTDYDIIRFLKRLYNGTEEYKTKEEALESILFIKVGTSISWKVNKTHDVFEIEKGKYLSFEACLFFITMFLYKNESNHLVPKISGYKRNEDDEMKSKRNLFTYFSKKYTSQDIDAEEADLVKFRDIIQYLNHYSTIWNKDLELDSKHPEMTEKLKEEIVAMEINRSYPDFINDVDFLSFAKNYLFSNEQVRNKIALKNIQDKLTEKERTYFEELTLDPHIKKFRLEIEKAEKPITFNIKEEPYKIFVKQHVLKTYFPNKFGYDQFRNFPTDKKKYKNWDDGFAEKLKTNLNTEKLKVRIAKNLLIKSYGRNQDRFMDIAMRYLAKEKYFGSDTLIKCYKFYNTIEQDNYLEDFKLTATKKEIENLPYHKGKLVHYISYDEHIENYPEWDTPFVLENNAITIQIELKGDIKIIPIQRNLMIYLLEHALYYGEKPSGKGLLLNYYLSKYKKDFNDKMKYLIENKSITALEKNAFKKLFPRRLLHHYSASVPNYTPEHTSLELILEKAKKQEKRYSDLLIKAEKEKTKEDFLKRNKGKQFKLQFIRKACHLMFFKETYKAQVGYEGHHKRFHITKDEFNDFSKWMFAFAGNDSYKKYLETLFNTKGFFDNKNFKIIFTESNSLDALYIKVKAAFSKWLTQANVHKDPNKYSLNNYQTFFTNNILHINVSHFREYLVKSKINTLNDTETIIYNSLANNNFLIESFYYKEKLESSEYKKHIKPYKKLRTNRLEDALLYEIAFRYLPNNANFAKTEVNQILTQNIPFAIDGSDGNHLYNLTIPFNKIESYTELKSKDYSSKSFNFLIQVQDYLSKTKVPKGKDKNGKKIYHEGNLNFEDLNTINNHIINEATKFTNVLMSLEEYFILKDQTVLLSGKNFIENEDITSLDHFSKVWKIWKDNKSEQEKEDVNFRNIACHFNLPIDDSLENILLKVEAKFIQQEIGQKVANFDDLPKEISRICKIFLKNIHNDYYLGLFQRDESKQFTNSIEEKKKRVHNAYLDKIINNLQF
jgi:hypothetical protein